MLLNHSPEGPVCQKGEGWPPGKERGGGGDGVTRATGRAVGSGAGHTGLGRRVFGCMS